jgi:hypothetical protein
MGVSRRNDYAVPVMAQPLRGNPSFALRRNKEGSVRLSRSLSLLGLSHSLSLLSTLHLAVYERLHLERGIDGDSVDQKRIQEVRQVVPPFLGEGWDKQFPVVPAATCIIRSSNPASRQRLAPAPPVSTCNPVRVRAPSALVGSAYAYTERPRLHYRLLTLCPTPTDPPRVRMYICVDPRSGGALA